MSQPPSLPPVSTLPRTNKRGGFWFILFAVVLLLGLGAMAAVARRGQKPTAVTTEKAVIKTITQTVAATGKIQPEVEVKIAPEVSGEIVELPFREGAPVKKGELILRIKPDNYKFQVDQAEASVLSAEASLIDNESRLTKAAADFKRNEELYAKQLIAETDYTAAKVAFEGAKAARENAAANITRAKGSLQQAQDQLEKTAIFSPIDGTISFRANELGERVAGTGQYGGADVMRVADLSNMEMRVNINENDIVNVKPGDKARVSIDAFPKRKFDAVVKEIAAAAKTSGSGTQDEVTNFLVKIRILDKDAPLKPGMSASVEVETQTAANVVAVPIQSVTVRTKDETAKTIEQAAADRDKLAAQNKGEGAATAVSLKQQKEQEKADREAFQRVVFVRDGDKVRQVPVETGIADTISIEIKSGLKAGDEVVNGSFTAITRTLKDGMAVTIAPAPGMAPTK
ncbi:MAG: efflux RND transporter periplasmic adaptor subunit [Verrucomicrobiota bacterium]